MQTASFTDQMNRKISIPFPPKRIISLVPSQTELLFDLGLANEVVAITKFCVHPVDQCKLKSKIGGTKKFNMDLIRSFKPDLIIGNKEENDKDQIEQLMLEFNVWMSDINDLNSALEMITGVGKLTGTERQATVMRLQIEADFANLKLLNFGKATRIAYLIWKNPYMLAGQDTFIADLIQRSGCVNAVQDNRYPEMTLEEIKDLKPDLIFLSSEPYPFKDKHIGEFRQSCPQAEVIIVDGEMFSWYGSRLLKATAYLQTLFTKQG